MTTSSSQPDNHQGPPDPIRQRPRDSSRHTVELFERSVLAEIEHDGVLTPERPLHELPAALGTKIETHVLMDFFSDFLVLDVFHSLKDVVNFLEVITIVVNAVVDRIENGRYFNSDSIAKIALGIEIPFAEIACVTNH